MSALSRGEKGLASEELAESAMDIHMMERGYTRIEWEWPNKQKSGQFDRIYEGPNGELIFVEAKGGASPLKGRKVKGKGLDNEGDFVQQGTRPYMEDTMIEMINKLGRTNNVSKKIKKVLDNKAQVKYLYVNQKVNSSNGSLGDLLISEFQL